MSSCLRRGSGTTTGGGKASVGQASVAAVQPQRADNELG